MPDWTTQVSALVIAVFVCLLACGLIIVTQRWHGAFSLDRNLTGKQKFHKMPVPRIGGAALVLGILGALAWLRLRAAPGPLTELTAGVAALLCAALPVFAIGLIEDMTKRVSVHARLGLTVASALLAWWALDAVLPPVGLPIVDDLLAYLPVAVAITAVAVAGVTNSINIIDGFNGLAASTAIAILSGLAYLGAQCGDALVLQLSLLGIAAAIGFLVANYPLGMLFMGDGGAYFLGFWCAETGLLLVCRNPGVNPWQVLALHAYPVIEVLYSMFRKKVLRGMSPTMPDRLHLHMLVYRRLVCQRLPRNPARPWVRNAAVTWLIAPWMATWTVAVVVLGTSASMAALLLLLHALAYLAIYVRLLRGHWCLHPGAIYGRLTRAVRARTA